MSCVPVTAALTLGIIWNPLMSRGMYIHCSYENVIRNVELCLGMGEPHYSPKRELPAPPGAGEAAAALEKGKMPAVDAWAWVCQLCEAWSVIQGACVGT